MIFPGIRRWLIPLFPVFLWSVGSVCLSAEESLYNVERLLNDVLLFDVEMSVNSPDGKRELWNNTVRKITIPGRDVKLEIEGDDARLVVSFTPYPSKDDALLLVARSETWISGKYSSTLTSIPIAYCDKVYYYPLGRAGETAEDTPAEVCMIIDIVPYLGTLNRADRKALIDALQSSSQFRLLEEG